MNLYSVRIIHTGLFIINLSSRLSSLYFLVHGRSVEEGP